MSTRRSSNQHTFAAIPSANIPRSTFSRGHGYKTTFDADYLVPFYVDEVLPGDTFNVRATLFARLATPIAPIMDNMYLDTFYFFVPNRLLWDNWQKFNGEQLNPGDSTDYLVPVVKAPPTTGWHVAGTTPSVSGVLSNSGVGLPDYFGLPTGVPDLQVSALWFRAYTQIYNEWFRDQNLQDRAYSPTHDGPDIFNDTYGTPDYNINANGINFRTTYLLMTRNKRHDYFTSCLPWPQKGPGVEIPIGTAAAITGTAPVIGNGRTLTLTDGTYNRGLTYARYTDTSGDTTYRWPTDTFQPIASGLTANVGTVSYANSSVSAPQRNINIGVSTNSNQSGLIMNANDSSSTLSVALDSTTAVTINALRQAFQIQKLYERDARGGTRYTEILRAHFGVVSPDARLQRPEYLGGSSTRIIVNPVTQTSSTDSTSPQGNLAAFGLVADHKGGFVKSFVEHGVIIGLLNVRADITYQQGTPRMWSRRSRFDFYWPALAHIGEQAVLNKEIYTSGIAAQDDAVFGYQERWAEYRYFPSQITGKFRSTYTQGTLDYWHLAQHFTTQPTLSAAFLNADTPVERVIAVPSEPHFILDCFMDIKAARPMPVYSVPGLIDHF